MVVREPGDIPCGGLPSTQELNAKMWPGQMQHRRYYQHVPVKATLEETAVSNIHRLVTHIQEYELRRQYMDMPPDTLGLRVKYLMNEITEDYLKSQLQRIEKTREKTRDIRDVLRMFCDVMSDIFRQFMVDAIGKKDIVTTYEGLRTYTKESFQTIHKRYNCSTPVIDDHFELRSHNWKPVKKEEPAQTV